MFELSHFVGIGEFEDKVCSLTCEYTSIKEKVHKLTPEQYDAIQKQVDLIKKENCKALVVISESLTGTSHVRVTGFDTTAVHFISLTNID